MFQCKQYNFTFYEFCVFRKAPLRFRTNITPLPFSILLHTCWPSWAQTVHSITCLPLSSCTTKIRYRRFIFQDEKFFHVFVFGYSMQPWNTISILALYKEAPGYQLKAFNVSFELVACSRFTFWRYNTALYIFSHSAWRNLRTILIISFLFCMHSFTTYLTCFFLLNHTVNAGQFLYISYTFK